MLIVEGDDQPWMVDNLELKLLLVEAIACLNPSLNWSPMNAKSTGLEALFENIKTLEKLWRIG